MRRRQDHEIIYMHMQMNTKKMGVIISKSQLKQKKINTAYMILNLLHGSLCFYGRTPKHSVESQTKKGCSFNLIKANLLPQTSQKKQKFSRNKKGPSRIAARLFSTQADCCSKSKVTSKPKRKQSSFASVGSGVEDV